MELAATLHFPLVSKILLSDRNRADLDWSKNEFTWRYRNRVTLERRIKIGSYHPAPYLSAKFFYESQYQKWSTRHSTSAVSSRLASMSSSNPIMSTRTILIKVNRDLGL
jgi:hypothetical protein